MFALRDKACIKEARFGLSMSRVQNCDQPIIKLLRVPHRVYEDMMARKGLAQREDYIRLDRQLRVVSHKPIVLSVGHLYDGRRLVQLVQNRDTPVLPKD